MQKRPENRPPLGGPGPEALVRAAQRLSTAPQRRRFYKDVSLERAGEKFALLLDRRAAKTPGGNPLAVAVRALAEDIAREWSAQGGTLDPSSMPLTRLVNAALDGVAGEMAAVRAEIVRYAGSDLICYRAGEPEGLVEAQGRAWDPVLDFMRERHGARFTLAQGVVFTPQPEAALAAVSRAVGAFTDPVPLAALSAVTTLTGSALIALALTGGLLDTAAAGDAAHIDEDFQWRLWGADTEAQARREARWVEMDAAGRVLGAHLRQQSGPS